MSPTARWWQSSCQVVALAGEHGLSPRKLTQVVLGSLPASCLPPVKIRGSAFPLHLYEPHEYGHAQAYTHTHGVGGCISMTMPMNFSSQTMLLPAHLLALQTFIDHLLCIRYYSKVQGYGHGEWVLLGRAQLHWLLFSIYMTGRSHLREERFILAHSLDMAKM